VLSVLRRFAVVGATAALAMGVLLAPPTTTAAQAADARTFDPAQIISDPIFYDSTTMTAAAIQGFLNTQGANCVAGAMPCLKDYVETTNTRAADAYCAGYPAAANETAAQIIAKVAASCGINPQVILVTLQKEESLVTISQPAAWRYQSAMGYGCPDSSVCNALYYGFFNQVYSASRQFQRYTKNPTGYNYRVGVTNTILYNPNTACGSRSVVIQNQATVNLYNYTPYTPDDALLAGTPDACSSYGNYNFWRYFTQWFGPTTDRAPFGYIDSASATDRSVTVAGWALDPDTTSPIAVHVYVDQGSAGQTSTAFMANLPRPDVDAVFHKGVNHGYSATVPVPLGAHQICVWALNDYGGPGSAGNVPIGCRNVNLVNHPPVALVEHVDGGSGTIRVAGWALDPDTRQGAAVQVAIDGAVTTVAPSVARPSIAAAYGASDPTGFDATLGATPGSHQVCITVPDAPGQKALDLGCRSTTVGASTPASSLTGAVPVDPVRLIDSWSSSPSATPQCVAVAGAGVPAAATGVMLNVTTVAPSDVGNVVVFPDDGTASPARPNASTVNFEVGQDVANGAWVQVGANGRICWSAQGAGPQRLVIDVAGYATTGSGLQLQSPQRLLDTRPATHIGDVAAAIPGGSEVPVTVAGRVGVPQDAVAVVLNATVVAPSGMGNLRVFPTGSGLPTSSNVNYAPGQTKSTAVLVPLGAGGKISLYSETASPFAVNVVLDVAGYVTAGGGGIHAVTPFRVLDTRPTAPTSLRRLPTLVAGAVASLDLRAAAAVPANATGAILSVTAIQPTTQGNLRVYPDTAGTGRTPPPWVSSVNYIRGRDIPNLVVVAIPADGRIDLFSDQFGGGTVDVAVDVVGYTTG
jgi:hypothetical protein